MMNTVATKEKIFARLICQDTLFINPFFIEDFKQMQEVLGGDCIAYLLPNDIVLWYSLSSRTNEFRHTVTVRKDGKNEYFFGNVLITSNDDESIQGIKNLSDEQMDWLRSNLSVEESELHRNHIMRFNLTN